MTPIVDGHAAPVMKLGQTTDGPQSWMTSSSGEVGRRGCQIPQLYG